MVTRRGPRGTDYCVLCNPGGYGKKATQDPDAEAIAEYRIPPETNDPPTGWQPICDRCVPTIRGSQYGRSIRPLDGYEDHPLFTDGEDDEVEHECEDPTWTKRSLVTEDGGFDWVRCDDCQIWAKRHGINRIEVVGHER